MPTSSLREQIIQNIKTTLEGITVANGYEIGVSEVQLIRMVNLNIKTFPTIIIIPDEETKRQSPVGKYTCDFTLGLECYLKEYVNIGTEVNKLLACVEKALMADYTRGGLAIDTHLEGNKAFYNELNKPEGGVIVMVRVVYRHAYDSPYTG